MTTGERAGKQINGDIQTSIADVQGTDAILDLIAAFQANEVLDSTAVMTAELV